jgi:hypothetical protein
MKEENKKTECCEKMVFKRHHHGCRCGQSNAIYGLSVIGALFYFLGNATSFGMVMLGIGKAIFWPAIFMFKLLGYLGM